MSRNRQPLLEQFFFIDQKTAIIALPNRASCVTIDPYQTVYKHAKNEYAVSTCVFRDLE